MTVRVLVAHEQEPAARDVVPALAGLGFVVVADTSELAEAARMAAEAKPDVALVDLVDGTDLGFALIDALVAARACPVLALVSVAQVDFARSASERGVFGVVAELQELAACADVACRRFAEYRDLGAALDRRAVIERASGILMERHGVDGHAAFAMLRTHARGANARVFDVAGSVIQGHGLLPASDS